MAELDKSEQKILDQRSMYNAAVNTFNVFIRSFPTVVISRMFAIQHQELFACDVMAKNTVKLWNMQPKQI